MSSSTRSAMLFPKIFSGIARLQAIHFLSPPELTAKTAEIRMRDVPSREDMISLRPKETAMQQIASIRSRVWLSIAFKKVLRSNRLPSLLAKKTRKPAKGSYRGAH